MNTQDKIVNNKLGLLTLAQTLGNASPACKELYETGGKLALQAIDRKKPCRKNRLEAVLAETVR